MYLRISCYCDACLNSSDLRVGVTTLLNTIQYFGQMAEMSRKKTEEKRCVRHARQPRHQD